MRCDHCKMSVHTHLWPCVDGTAQCSWYCQCRHLGHRRSFKVNKKTGRKTEEAYCARCAGK